MSVNDWGTAGAALDVCLRNDDDGYGNAKKQ